MKQTLLVGSIITIFATNAFAVSSTVTSKDYVDTVVATKQAQIPASGASGVGSGETVMTYTSTSGTIGERGIYSDTSSYDASADGDKIITASALNSAFTTLPTTETTKLVCANPGTCTLWSITGQTAYGISGSGTTTVDLTSLIGNVAGTGYTSNDSSGNDYDTYGMSNSIISGDPMAFAVDYGDKGMIKGHGRCSTQSGTGIWNGASGPEDVTTTSTLPDSSGQYCYCQLDGYTTDGGTMTSLSAPWVFDSGYGDASKCAGDCAYDCAEHLRNVGTSNLAFRAAVFNSVQ